MDCVSNSDRLLPCEMIKGTKRNTKPTIKHTNNSNVAITAMVLENFNFERKNSTIGFAINEKITATTI